MLPRAEAPAKRLPYTTVGMSELLAKKKAEYDAKAQAIANQALRRGVTNPPIPAQEDKGGGTGWWPSWKELGNATKTGFGVAAGAVNTIAATPIDIADEAVQGLERLVGVTPTDKFDPASIGSYNLLGEAYRGIDNAAQYVGQQIAATPGFGKPSSSPFMDTLRSKGVAEALAEPFVHAVNVGSVAYPVSKMAVGAKLPGTIADAYRQRLLERDIAAQNNLFPAVQRPANVIDVDALQGSRLPARVVDSPTTPASRLAEAQVQRGLPPANVPKPGMVLPDSLAGIRNLPNLPSQLNFADFQSMPEYQQYLQAGQQLPTAKELADFGFDLERAYMVHGGPGDLVGGVLDPNFTGARNMGTKSLNTSMRENLVTNYKQADSIVNGLSTGLANFEQTGIWNGPQILDNVTKLMNKDASRILPVNELGLNQIINVNNMPNKEFFVGKIRNMINSYQKTVTKFGPAAKLAEQGDYLSVFPASVGTYKGAVAPTNGATYLVSSPAEQITNLMGFNNVADTGLPEYQMFGQQSPLAAINYGNAGSSLNVEQLAAARAFFLRKVIEDRMARGLYEQPLAPPSPTTPATRLGNALAQMTLDAQAAQGGVRDAGVLRMPGSYPAGERYVFDYNQSDPAYAIDKQSTNEISRSYDKVGPGEKLIDTKGTETGVPGRSYTSNKMILLESPQGKATLGYDIENRVVNGTPQPRIVLKPISSAIGTPTQVKQLLDFLYGRYKNAVIDWGNISTELPNELFYEYNNRFPIRTVGESVGNPLENFNAPKTNINVLLDTPQRGTIPYTELYDAIGVLDNNRIYPTSEFKQLIQKFGLQGREREVLDAFARREGIVEPSRLTPMQQFINEMQRQMDMGDYFEQ
jgi:hypothetical protein